jgi:transcriptional regulator of met regulon
MSNNTEHTFKNKEFFIRMKTAHLTRVKSELVKVSNWMGNDYGVEIDIQQEVSLSLISFLLRRCDELEYIKLNELRFKLNSVLHAHMVMHIKDGAIIYKSDDDIKKERQGVLIDNQFINELILKVDNWLESKL